ncbi:MAG: hypothetical protein HYY49_05425 [Ignavibacteriales bacterium]|nr:hypothetical protein [Ignavibacteriales bacterium]
MIYRKYIVPLMFSLCISSCESPVEFSRTNVLDPQNELYVPPPPSGISLTSTKNVAILTWRDSSVYEDGYIVEKAIDDSTTFKILAVLPPNSTTYSDSSGDISLNTWYRVGSYKQKTDKRDLILTQPVKLSLGNVTSLFSAPTEAGDILITWNENSSFESGFVVEVAVWMDTVSYPFQRAATSSDTTFYELVRVSADVSSYVDTSSLTFGMFRRYQVSMVRNRAGNELVLDQSETYFGVNQWMSPMMGGINLPPMTILDEERIRLFWADQSKFEDGFEIQRKAPGQSFHTFVALTSPNATSYDDTTNLMNGGDYSYLVRGKKGSRFSFSTGVGFTYTIATPVLRLNNSSATDQITLSWTHETSLAVRYIIDQSVNGGPFQTAAIIPVPSFQYTLPADTTKTYRYRVRSASSSVSNGVDAKYFGHYDLRFTAGISGASDIAFSPDGQYLAVGGSLLSVVTGSVVRTFTPCNAVAFSPTGDTLVTGSTNSVGLWNVLTGSRLINLTPVSAWQNDVSDVAFSPSGQYVASICYDGKATVWNLVDTAIVSTFGYTGFGHPQSVSFKADGTKILSTGRGTTPGWSYVDVVDVATGVVDRTIGEYYGAWDVQWSPNGSLIALSTNQYLVLSLFDLAANQAVWTALASRGRFADGGNLLLYNGSVLNVPTRAEVSRTSLFPLYGLVAISEDASLIANSPNPNEVSIFARTGKRWKSTDSLSNASF